MAHRGAGGKQRLWGAEPALLPWLLTSSTDALPGVSVAPSVGADHGGVGTEEWGLPGHLGDPVMARYPLGYTQKLGSSGPPFPKSQNSSSLLESSPLHQVLSSTYPARNFRCIYLVRLISPWHFSSLPLTTTNGSDSCSPGVEFPGTREPASGSVLYRLRR